MVQPRVQIGRVVQVLQPAQSLLSHLPLDFNFSAVAASSPVTRHLACVHLCTESRLVVLQPDLPSLSSPNMTSSIDLQNLSISTTSLTLKDLQPDYARSEMENVVLGLRDRPKQEGTLHELYMTLHEHHPVSGLFIYLGSFWPPVVLMFASLYAGLNLLQERYPMCRDADGSAKRCSPTCTDCDTMEPRRNSVKAALGRAQGCHDVKWMGRGT